MLCSGFEILLNASPDSILVTLLLKRQTTAWWPSISDTPMRSHLLLCTGADQLTYATCLLECEQLKEPSPAHLHIMTAYSCAWQMCSTNVCRRSAGPGSIFQYMTQLEYIYLTTQQIIIKIRTATTIIAIVCW